MDMDLDMCRVRCKVAGGVHPVLTPILAFLALWKPVSCKGTSFTHSYYCTANFLMVLLLRTATTFLTSMDTEITRTLTQTCNTLEQALTHRDCR
jgi:hypothetical protein